MRLVLVACLIACSSSPPPSSPAPAVPTAPPAPAPVLDLRPFAIHFDGKPIARLHADGRTESVGDNPPGGPFVAGPTLHADGTIDLTKGDFKVRVEKGGDYYLISPTGETKKIGRIADNRLRVEPEGGVHVENATLIFDPPAPPNVIGTIEGPVDDGTRHTALVLTAVFFLENAIVKGP